MFPLVNVFDSVGGPHTPPNLNRKDSCLQKMCGCGFGRSRDKSCNVKLIGCETCLWTRLSNRVGQPVGWPVCHNFRKGRKDSLPCFYGSTCFNYCKTCKNCKLFNPSNISSLCRFITCSGPPLFGLLIICITYSGVVYEPVQPIRRELPGLPGPGDLDITPQEHLLLQVNDSKMELQMKAAFYNCDGQSLRQTDGKREEISNGIFNQAE